MLGGIIEKIERAAVIVVVILTLLVFYPVYSHDFVTWDDTHNVAANQDMLAPSWEKVDGTQGALTHVWTLTTNVSPAPSTKLYYEDNDVNPIT